MNEEALARRVPCPQGSPLQFRLWPAVRLACPKGLLANGYPARRACLFIPLPMSSLRPSRQSCSSSPNFCVCLRIQRKEFLDRINNMNEEALARRVPCPQGSPLQFRLWPAVRLACPKGLLANGYPARRACLFIPLQMSSLRSSCQSCSSCPNSLRLLMNRRFSNRSSLHICKAFPTVTVHTPV